MVSDDLLWCGCRSLSCSTRPSLSPCYKPSCVPQAWWVCWLLTSPQMPAQSCLSPCMRIWSMSPPIRALRSPSLYSPRFVFVLTYYGAICKYYIAVDMYGFLLSCGLDNSTYMYVAFWENRHERVPKQFKRKSVTKRVTKIYFEQFSPSFYFFPDH